MIGVKCLVDTVNSTVDSISTPLEALQLASVVKDFDQTGFVSSVASASCLPPAANNTGRFIYIQDTCSYKFSDGVAWTADGSSQLSQLGLASWGRNVVGALGDGTEISKCVPERIPSVADFEWRDISAGIRLGTSGAVKCDGTMWMWGNNGCGILGDGTTVNKCSPVSVIGGFADWSQVEVGQNHTVALRSNGSIWTWGSNNRGQLGDGTGVNKSSPISIIGGFTDWCQVSAGDSASGGVRSNGTLWMWGNNGCGTLGDGTTVNKNSPVSVIGGFTDWCQVSVSNVLCCAHTLGLRSNGTLWAWGSGRCGTLGDGTTVDKSSPVSVVGGFTDWCQASVGGCHSLAVRSNGTAWAWGEASNGRLGDGTLTDKCSPVSVLGGFTDWCQVSAGCDHSLGVRTNGTAWAWGWNFNGQLGNDGTTNEVSPVPLIGIPLWSKVEAGCGFSLGLGIKGF